MKNLPACLLALSLAACTSDRTTSGGPCNCPGGGGGDDGGQAGEATGGKAGTSPGGASPGGRGGSSGSSTEGGQAGAGEGGCAACGGEGGEATQGGSGGFTGGMSGSDGDPSGAGGISVGGLGGLSGAGVGGAGSGGKAGGGAGGCLACAGSGNAMPVNLRSAANYVILAKSAISTVPQSDVVGNLGISPAAATYITGFSLVADATNVFATSTQVTGQVFAASYANPTPSNLTTAVLDMQAAFVDAAGRSPDVTELAAGDISGMVLAPGTYKWSSGLLASTDVSLSGPATGTWIFQVAQTLTVANAARIELSGGGLAKNVFWQVSGAVSLGTTAHVEGVVLGMTSIVLGTGATVNGRLLAQTAVVLDANVVTQPAP